VGGGEGEAEAHSPGHRQYHDHGVRGSDGGAEGLQPAPAGEEGAAAAVEFRGRDRGVRAGEAEASDQYQLFASEHWKYRVFVTNRDDEKRAICREYEGRATAENYIKEGCNDAGFGVLSGQNFKANQNYLQMAILAYNSNRWLQLMALGERERYQRRQLRTERLRLVFVAAKLVVHEGRSWVRFSQSYGEQDRFDRLMERLRSIKQKGGTYTSSRAAPLTAWVFS
jgi:hypothetical protein